MSNSQVESVKLGELNCWRVTVGKDELLVTQQGAQVLSYQRDSETPLIWLNEHANFITGKAARAGVPVCWPWFGVFKRNPEPVQAMRTGNRDEAGPHGLVRAINWRLLGIEDQSEGRVSLSFDVPQAEEGTLPGWPHKVSVTMTIVLDQQLHISLTSQNLDDHPVSLSQALHSYFAVSDIHQVSAQGFAGLSYHDTTTPDWDQLNQSGDIKFERETDRIYLNTPSELSIVDQNWKRRIRLVSSGSNNTIVWNPWTERAAALADMADDGWQRMLCIETANVLDDVVTLAPGERHTMSVTIDSEAL
ncbi:D-hexose-6-phosphate mutarotase [Pseudomonas sp. HR96]|uniref:D-hexose-6-phosphate mutarotase n=1 Tax=Pseudomonas sp. HR96 TaxID=1027966 RepID=UPI002A761535|nr:D-hexose-6-phosphate mutarotase [Pseudomonas sp. HR96]WPO99995.1 D-hexose-6-phosphate mutarotase [Pseudomonas sp. HR96]